MRNVPFNLQLEVINLQCEDMSKGKHQERNPIDFSNCLPGTVYNQLKLYTHGLISVFDSTCVKRHFQMWGM